MIIEVSVSPIDESGRICDPRSMDVYDEWDLGTGNEIVLNIPIAKEASGLSYDSRHRLAISKLEWAKLLEAGKAFLIEPVREPSP